MGPTRLTTACKKDRSRQSALGHNTAFHCGKWSAYLIKPNEIFRIKNFDRGVVPAKMQLNFANVQLASVKVDFSSPFSYESL